MFTLTIEMRPRIQELIEDIKTGLYDAVMVIDQDRLSRGAPEDAEYIKNVFIKYGVLLIEGTKIFDLASEQDEFVYDMKSFIARQEYKTIKKRLRRGKIQAAKKGLWANGIPPLPYYYDKEKQILEVDPSLNVIYRYIIDAVVKYQTPTTEIAHELNLKGWLTAGRTKRGRKFWTSKTVRDTLIDLTHLEWKDDKGNIDINYGHIVIGKTKGNAHKKKSKNAESFERIDSDDWKKIKGLHKPLKTTAEHEAIMLFLGRNTKMPKRTISKTIFPLTKILKCAFCGHFLTFSYRDNRGGLLSVRRCWYHDELGKACVNRSGPLQVVVEKINQHIEFYIKDMELNINSVDKGEIDKLEERIRLIAKELKDKDNAMKGHEQMFERGSYTIERYDSIYKRIEKEKKGLSEAKKLAELELKYLHDKSSTEKIDILTEFQEIIKNPDLTWEEQNALYKTIIECVVYTRQDNEIQLEIIYK